MFALHAWFIVPGFSISYLDFLSREDLLRTRLARIFLFAHPPFSKRVGRSIANDHYRGVLEYSLTGRHSKVSENETSSSYTLRFYLKIRLHLLSGLLVRRVDF